ncbi:MAG: peptidoglycan-binding protein [Vicinamibacterales bacterium]
MSRTRDLARLHARLVFLGDMPDDVPGPSSVYAGAIVDAVKRFQQRHGLQPDGVVGRQTIAHLEVSMRTRVEQIELALERQRWLPHEGGPLIVVNIPMFRLLAWETTPADGAPAFMRRARLSAARSRRRPRCLPRR